MKKLFIIISCLVVLSFSTFADISDAFTNSIQQAQNYEKQQKWIHALSEYYNAMEASPSEGHEALDRYTEIYKEIYNGNPGPGEYDDFSLYAGWIDLIKETEDFFSENPVADFVYEMIKLDPDYDTMTYSYEMYMTGVYSEKANDILTAVISGFEKSKNSNWKKIPYNWPAVSVYEASKSNEVPLAVYDTPEEIKGAKNYRFISTSIEVPNSSTSYSYRGNQFSPELGVKSASPAWVPAVTTLTDTGIFSKDPLFQSAYTMQFDLIDEDGNILISSELQPVPIEEQKQRSSYFLSKRDSEFVLKGVKPADAKKIDSGNFRIRINQLNLNSVVLKGKQRLAKEAETKSISEVKSDAMMLGLSQNDVNVLYGYNNSGTVDFEAEYTVDWTPEYTKVFPLKADGIKTAKIHEDLGSIIAIVKNAKQEKINEENRKAEEIRQAEEARIAAELKAEEEAKLAEEERLAAEKAWIEAEKARLEQERVQLEIEQARIAKENEKYRNPVVCAELFEPSCSDSATAVTTVEQTTRNGQNAIIFSGNTGSVKTDWGWYEINCYDEKALEWFKDSNGISFSVLGDGNTYSVTFCMGQTTYSYKFKTTKNKITVVNVPYSKLTHDDYTPKIPFHIKDITGFRFKFLNISGNARYPSNKKFSITVFDPALK